MKKLITLFLLMPLSFVFAAEPEEKKDFYDVEIVLFAQADGYSYEKWPEQPEFPSRSKAISNLSKPLPNTKLHFLAPDQLELGPMVYTLNKKQAKVYAHIGVRLEVPDRNTDRWYWIGEGPLQGLIKITRGRYLHVNTDLMLANPNQTQRYRIQMHRKMRRGELHYMDHPMAGLLVQANRYEPEKIIEEVPTESLPGELFEKQTPAPTEPAQPKKAAPQA